MKYPIIIHKDNVTGYGITIPDIPGCFAYGSALDEAINNIQEAVELYYDDERVSKIPTPSSIADLKKSNLYTSAARYSLVDIDFHFLPNKGESPFDIPGTKTKATTEDILIAVKESRAKRVGNEICLAIKSDYISVCQLKPNKINSRSIINQPKQSQSRAKAEPKQSQSRAKAEPCPNREFHQL